MILPIYTYGQPVLREPADDVPADLPNLPALIAAMFETMYNASGVGLAAPQIGHSLRMFVMDAEPMQGRVDELPGDTADDLVGFKRVFINPEIVDERGERYSFEEGCLSIPGLREGVRRPSIITIQYYDAELKPREETYSGIRARIMQHEFDHLNGTLFTDLVSPFRRQLNKKRLLQMSRGHVEADYPLAPPPGLRRAAVKSS